MITSSVTNARNIGIDLLRGVAILSVVLLHLNLQVKFNQTGLGEWLPGSLNRVLFWSGFYGVAMFFVISGYLLSLIHI